jgi:serine phosphatase RsbU (regulator of sigma subunit)
VVLIWGGVIGSVAQNALMDQIMRDGIEGVKILSCLGNELSADFEIEQRDPSAPRGKWPKVLDMLKSFDREGKELSDIVDAKVLAQGGGRAGFLALAQVRDVDLVSFDRYRKFSQATDVTVAEGKAKLGGRDVPAVSFKQPFYGQMGGQAILVLSSQRVQDQVGDLWKKMLGAGLIFLVIAVFVSLWLAVRVTSPIKQLVSDMDIVSRGDLNHTTRATSGDEIGLLANAFNRMTKSLRDAREAEKQVEAFESELNAAQEVQASLLPPRIPQIPGYDIFPAYSSAKEVGGDYYDFIPIDKEHLGLVVADVSGKGIPGSMVMYGTRTKMRMMAPDNTSAADTLKKVNYWVAKDIKRGMFVTALYAILDVRQKEICVCSAGHNPMLLYRERTGQVEEVNPHGIALGFDPGPIFNRTCKEERVKLESGDRVLMYTDGVVEAMDENHEEFTDERLKQFVKENARMSSKDFVRYLLKVLDEHKGKAEQHDDITIVTFKVE